MQSVEESQTSTDERPDPDSPSGLPWKPGVVAAGLTVLGLVATVVFSVPVVLTTDGLVGFVGAIVAGELGYVAAGVVFLLATGRGLGFLDRSVPDGRTLATYLVGATLGLFALRTAIVGTASVAGVPLAPPSIFRADLDPRTILLALIPLSILVVGPCEELLFRGVIQEYLDGPLSTRGAIVGAGVLFASIHVPSLAAVPSVLGTVVTLVVIFLVGIGLGAIYDRTGSLPVVMGVHGLYNATIAASAYLLIVFGVISV